MIFLFFSITITTNLETIKSKPNYFWCLGKTLNADSTTNFLIKINYDLAMWNYFSLILYGDVESLQVSYLQMSDTSEFSKLDTIPNAWNSLLISKNTDRYIKKLFEVEFLPFVYFKISQLKPKNRTIYIRLNMRKGD